MKRGVQRSFLDKLTVSAPEHVLFQRLGNETVILDISSGEYYGLNQVGSRIWILFQEGLTGGDVLDSLTREYDVSVDRLQDDLERFLDVLQTRSLIEVHAKVAS